MTLLDAFEAPAHVRMTRAYWTGAKDARAEAVVGVLSPFLYPPPSARPGLTRPKRQGVAMDHLAPAYVPPEDAGLFKVTEPGWYAFDDDHTPVG
jgi:hypothetical protein